MSLKLQIYSVFFSFLFGIFFSVTLLFIYKKIKLKKRAWRVLFNLLFILTHTFLYYFILEKVNNGILHPYCILSILVGFILSEGVLVKLR